MSRGARFLAESAQWMAYQQDFREPEPEQLPRQVVAPQRFTLAELLTDSDFRALMEFRQNLRS